MKHKKVIDISEKIMYNYIIRNGVMAMVEQLLQKTLEELEKENKELTKKETKNVFKDIKPISKN